MPGRTSADVVVDRPELRMSGAAQARAKFRVRSPQGWTSARDRADLRSSRTERHRLVYCDSCADAPLIRWRWTLSLRVGDVFIFTSFTL